MDHKMPVNFEMIVAKAVRDIGIPANIRGYYCLIDAVKIAVVDKLAVSDMTAKIYTPLANRYGSTTQKVSSYIARAIQIGWDRSDLATLEKYFGSRAFNACQFPENQEVVKVLADRVRANREHAGIAPTERMSFAERRTENIKEMAIKTLHELKVPAHLKGFQYLIDAITLAAENMDLINTFALSKVLYPVVAQHFNSTPARIEHAMSYAIEALWDVGDVETLQSWFGCTVSNTKGKPTNGEFIALIADTIHRTLS